MENKSLRKRGLAKKTIISDFSVLKGKVTFSEKSSAPTPKPKDSEEGLKVGQSVVLMDSDLRGKITFIHGIGDGILKAAIRKELNEVLALRCSYSVGDPAVTIVYIR